MELIINVVCAVCWFAGGVLALINADHDYRVPYIIAAFLLSCTYTIHLIMIRMEMKQNDNERISHEQK